MIGMKLTLNERYASQAPSSSPFLTLQKTFITIFYFIFFNFLRVIHMYVDIANQGLLYVTVRYHEPYRIVENILTIRD